MASELEDPIVAVLDIKRLRNERSMIRSFDAVLRPTKVFDKSQGPKRSLNLVLGKLNAVVKEL